MLKWGLSSGTPADSYYEVRSDCTSDVPKSKFKIKVYFSLSLSSPGPFLPWTGLLFRSLSVDLVVVAA
jgi:hypothetical protein